MRDLPVESPREPDWTRPRLTHVGHYLSAGSFDRRALDRLQRQHPLRPGIVGVEVGLSLLEQDLISAWSSRHAVDPIQRAFSRSHIRGLLLLLRHVTALPGVTHRKAVGPIGFRGVWR